MILLVLVLVCCTCLNESPHPKVGKFLTQRTVRPRRRCLNESPHPKVGKLQVWGLCVLGLGQPQ